MVSIDIHINRPDHLNLFIELNERWVQEHFALEESDAELASDPGAIIRNGGAISTAVEDGIVVGACALVRHDSGKYELARMAVDPEHQGRGIVAKGDRFI